MFRLLNMTSEGAEARANRYIIFLSAEPVDSAAMVPEAV
jgi:hypothetical protein